MIHATSLLIALLIDAAADWPTALFARLSHPVVWIGALISACEQGLNKEDQPDIIRRAGGVITVILVVGSVAGAALLLTRLLPGGWGGILIAGLFGWPFLAARSLHEHVADVGKGLAESLPAGRAAVSRIVGRDPEQLDEAGVARAAIESLAENTSDGVIAPLFWGVLLGLPGLAAYKAINTLDSMIGHRTQRHEAFGWAAARLDDLVNLVPARLTGLLFAGVSVRSGTALRVMWRDAGHHRSPNAGWPEAAMAGALGIRLSGPRLYAGRIAEEPYVNANAADPAAADISRALALYRRAMVLAAGLLLALAALERF